MNLSCLRITQQAENQLNLKPQAVIGWSLPSLLYFVTWKHLNLSGVTVGSSDPLKCAAGCCLCCKFIFLNLYILKVCLLSNMLL